MQHTSGAPRRTRRVSGHDPSNGLSAVLDTALQTATDLANTPSAWWKPGQIVWCTRFLNAAIELNRQLRDEAREKCAFFARLSYWCRLHAGFLENASLALEGLPASVHVLNAGPTRPAAAFGDVHNDTGCLDFLKAVSELPSGRVEALTIGLVRQPGELEPVCVSILIEALVAFVRHIVGNAHSELRKCANLECDRACLVTGRGGAWVDPTRLRLPWAVFHAAERTQRGYWSEAAGEEQGFCGHCCSLRCSSLIADEVRRVLPFTCDIHDPTHYSGKPMGVGVAHAELAAFSRNCEASRRLKAAAQQQQLRYCSPTLIGQYRRMLVRAVNADALLVHAAALAFDGDMRIPSPTLPFVATHDWRQGITYRAALLRIHKIIKKHDRDCARVVKNSIFAQDGVLEELRASVRKVFE